MDEIERIARQRIADRNGSPAYVAFPGDQARRNERIGVAGEIGLAEFFGFPHVASENRERGDGGIDCWFLLRTIEGERRFSVDIKTSLTLTNLLLVETRKAVADIYILGRYDPEAGKVTELIGWQWCRYIKKHGTIRQRFKLNYELPREELRNMQELKDRFIKRL